MKTPTCFRAAAALFLFLAIAAGGGARGLEVKLRLTETEKVRRSPAVVTSGVPFARGALKDVSGLCLKVGGKAVPAQFAATVKWDDGSVRWALLDTQVEVPAGGSVEMLLTDGGGNPAPAAPVKVEEGPDSIRLYTGPLVAVIGRKKPGLLESVKVDGKELVTGAGRGLVVLKEGGGEVVADPPTEVRVEQAGPLRAVVCLRGRFPGVHEGLLGYTVRVTALAGRKLLGAQVWLENHGAMGYYAAKDEGGTSPSIRWFAFDGMAVELGLGLGESPTARCEGVEGAGSLRVYQGCRMATGQEKVQYKKGPFYTWKDFEYVVSSGEKELKRGDRTDGVVELSGGGAALTVAVRDFWQNYEKAVELEGKALRFWLWPVEGQWPRERPNLRSGGLFDKTLQALPKKDLYLLAGGVRKGHEAVLDFSGRPAAETSTELSAPLFAMAEAGYYAATEAAPGLFAPPGVRTGDGECDFRLASWERMTRSAVDPANPQGLPQAMQTAVESGISYISDTTYWYGWMDYGDLTVPGRGPVSLHYDWTWIMLASAMRTGEPAFLRIGSTMARHRIDVDQHWSDSDPPEVRGLQRGDFNFPSFNCYRLYRYPGVTTNWLAGVVLYYMLTGDARGLECAARNADGLKAGWEHVARTKPWGGPQGDMAANGWGITSYCAMYDLTADRKWLDEALGLFNTNVTAKWKAQGPFLHDGANQIRSQDYIKEDMKYCYAIAPLCELHRRTGDENVMKLLKEGCEKKFPDSFYEAPRYLADLYAYVGHKTGDAALIDKGAEFFAQAFPESKCPPVFLPGNSTWSRDSAMMLRTGHLLQYAHWKKAGTKGK